MSHPLLELIGREAQSWHAPDRITTRVRAATMKGSSASVRVLCGPWEGAVRKVDDNDRSSSK